MTRRRLMSLLLPAALVGSLATVPVDLAGGPEPAGAAPTDPATASERVVTLVGSLQDELGCEGDWDPGCEQTRLEATGEQAWSGTFEVPAGEWAVKVALDGSWDESHPAQDLPLVLQGPAEVAFGYDGGTDAVTVAPVGLSGDQPEPVDEQLAAGSLREASTEEQFYFVMADRFANGDPGNDTGGIEGDRLDHGFDPTDKGFYHGGDLAGIQERLDYIEGLGTTAIWLTPSFANRPVQGTGPDASAGYHGYWVTDFTRIDPHLGSNEEMRALIDEAHARGMKVYFDIITNHTADVIDYEEGQYGYVPKGEVPYTDAAGTTFDDADYAGTGDFPEIDPATSFPHTPVFRAESDATAKVPGWLNDPQYYHNRGDTTWAGESVAHGDFFGLDDLWTERPEVVEGMVDIYASWARMGIDGFRIDTVKHVNMEFWQEFTPRVLEAAREGNEGFFAFGEVFDGDPRVMSRYTTEGGLQATLDFGFQGRAVEVAGGGATTALRDLWQRDDYYTDADSNAYQLPTFLGNHDMGRVGWMLRSAGHEGQGLQQRLQLAHSLMFLGRGQPVVYYGDEQGLVGSGGDKDARQSLFATQVEQYAQEPVVGGEPGSRDRYDTGHPLYRHVAELAALRGEHPALVDGAQVHRYATGGAGLLAWSRIDAEEQVEYLVVANNSGEPASASIPTYQQRGVLAPVHGTDERLRADAEGRVEVAVDPLSVEVYRAVRPLAPADQDPRVRLADPGDGGQVAGRAEIRAATPGSGFAQVGFAVRPVGTSDWQHLGVDDNAPFRVFHDVAGLADGTLLEYRTVLTDAAGTRAVDTGWASVGEGSGGGDGGGSGGGEAPGPVEQPDALSVPGTHNTEMGCAGDWAPDCPEAQLALDPDDQLWKGTWQLAGEHEYKAAVNGSWDENYGAGAVRDGSNVGYTGAGGPVTFYYDHRTHWVTSDAEGPVLTAPGSYQDELGCPADWAPDCMRPWLQDPDGDGTYTWSTTEIPAGSYELKVTHGLSWDENYGEGGVPGGPNVALDVPDDDVVVTISYDLQTHEVSARTSQRGVAAELTSQRAHWVSADTIAWPADAVPGDAEPEELRWRLAWAAGGGLAVGSEAVTGGESAGLRVDPAGLPAEATERFPHLAGHLALRLDRATTRQAGEILRGQVAVGVTDDTGRLVDATGVQLPGVLDDLYAERATGRDYGPQWREGRPTLRVWAPTAQQVDLLLWSPDAAADAPVAEAGRYPMRRAGDGSWSVRGRAGWEDGRYLYEVTVLVPDTGEVQTARVTDPASLALTLDSTRSVLVDLADDRWRPQAWRAAAAPTLEQEVDQAVYELHVRDFSVSDPDVPEELRGSYLAFTEQGRGREHLEALAAAGLNTVHLLPTFDIASIGEDPAQQQEPPCDLASLPPDSTEQQACVRATAGQDAFNWGYDPWHFSVPEGSYASTAAAADGGHRVAEFRSMVGGLHQAGLRVVLDQVFNHTAQSGQGEKSVLDKVVPGYYHRLDEQGWVHTSTCCQNLATEHAMAEKLMVDSVVVWARDYKVDGFRFDLMGHHSRANMLAVREALDALTPGRDGVYGSAVTLYGEGWDFGEVSGDARFTQAIQGQLEGTHIATFNDRLRDAVRGGGPFDDDPRLQGFGSGQLTDPNGAGVNGDEAAQRVRLLHDTDLLQLGMTGNLRGYTFRSARTGEPVTGSELDYNGAPAGYAEHPDESLSYVDAHDNETLFDSLALKLPVDTPMADRVRMNTVSLASATLGQSPVLWHAGTDLLRSKSLDRNSYDSGDWFNLLDWTMTENGFARGLPPAPDNEDKWEFMRPLLADPGLKPGPADIRAATAQAQDLLRLRGSTPLFRLGDPDLVRQKLGFPASGTEHAHDGVVVMHLDDTVGPDVDPDLARVVVVLNARPEPVEQVVPGLAGEQLRLHPVQAGGADPVVRETAWDAATGSATVPARTVSVLIQP